MLARKRSFLGGIKVFFLNSKLLTHEVFGLSNEILNASYVDRGNLDSEIQRYLQRRTHIALRGESKCGKSWFRKRNIDDALVVQCRYKKTVTDIYTDALSQLGINLIMAETKGSNIRGRVEASSTFGASILAKIAFNLGVDGQASFEKKEEVVGRDINDLRYIAEIFIKSGKRLVIEDFHYLSVEERKVFSYDLKTLWDYGCFVVIIGVWSQSNMLTFLNADLSGRINEVSIYWSPDDLKKVLNNGCQSLNIEIQEHLIEELVSNCFGNVGILQQLVLFMLDDAGIYEEQSEAITIDDRVFFENAAKKYADQLNALYQQFARTVSSGIRKRKDSTGIYAHALAVIVQTNDAKLINGLELNEIFQVAHQRQPRILKNNMRTILTKLEELQVDEDGRGLVIAFNESTDEITAVDRQLLFYRKYLTVNWPWEELIAEAEKNQGDPNQIAFDL